MSEKQRSTAEKEERLYNYQVKSLERKQKEADEKLDAGTRHLFNRVKYATESQEVYRQLIDLIATVPALEEVVAKQEKEHDEAKEKHDAWTKELDEARTVNEKLLENEDDIEKRENQIPQSIIDGVKRGKKLEEEFMATRDDGKVLLETAGLLGEQYEELAGNRQKLGDGIIEIFNILKDNTNEKELVGQLEPIANRCEEDASTIIREVEQHNGLLQ